MCIAQCILCIAYKSYQNTECHSVNGHWPRFMGKLFLTFVFFILNSKKIFFFFDYYFLKKLSYWRLLLEYERILLQSIVDYVFGLVLTINLVEMRPNYLPGIWCTEIHLSVYVHWTLSRLLSVKTLDSRVMYPKSDEDLSN